MHMDIDHFAEQEPAVRDERFRIEMTSACRDCDILPKVDNAGEVILRDGQPVQIMHNGVQVVADGYGGPWMTEIIRRLGGHHEPQEELVFDAILRLVGDGASMIEFGGYWSYYSLWFLAAGRNRRSLVVEPDPNNLDIGRRNAALNGASIDFRQGFIGAQDRTDERFHTETAGVQMLPMIRPSRLCREWAPNGLDILHCDTQGAETLLIQDCAPLLREHRVRFLIVSTHAELISRDALTHQRCLDMIRSFGGQILEEHDVHESFSGDGLIAAHFGAAPVDWPRLDLSRNRYATSLFRNPAFDLRTSRLSLDRMSHALEMLEAENRRLRSALSAFQTKEAAYFDENERQEWLFSRKQNDLLAEQTARIYREKVEIFGVKEQLVRERDRLLAENMRLLDLDRKRQQKFLPRKLRELGWTLERWARVATSAAPQSGAPVGDEADAMTAPGETVVATRPAHRPRPRLDGVVARQIDGPRILIDVTHTHRLGFNTGIQRVCRKVAEFAALDGKGVPVVIENGALRPYYDDPSFPDPITLRQDDRYLVLDASWEIMDEHLRIAEMAEQAGARIVTCLYDLIPIRYPRACTESSTLQFGRWLERAVYKSDAVIAISRSVAEDFQAYVRETGAVLKPGQRLGWWHLGADMASRADAAPSTCVAEILSAPEPFFLSVGTVEPRKAYRMALDAFERLWARGVRVNYVIAGKAGWNTAALAERIRSHPQFGRRLFWFESSTDTDLAALYRHAHSLVITSLVEGFGLPVVEARHYGLPVIASDIPVFREIGGDEIDYFEPLNVDALLARLQEGLSHRKTAASVTAKSWAESSGTLLDLIRNDNYQFGSIS